MSEKSMNEAAMIARSAFSAVLAAAQKSEAAGAVMVITAAFFQGGLEKIRHTLTCPTPGCDCLEILEQKARQMGRDTVIVANDIATVQ